MRRLARHVFTLCSAVSLLLCVAVCVLWVRSYFYGDYFSHSRVRGWTDFSSASGFLWLTVGTNGPASRGNGQWSYRDLGAGWLETDRQGKRNIANGIDGMGGGLWEPSTRWRVGGVEYIRAVYHDRHWTLFLPYWLLTLITVAAPFASVGHRLRAHRRAERGLCPTCGYDLRASPERCPECGVEATGEVSS